MRKHYKITDGATANLGGDLYRLGGGEDGERPLDGEAGLRLGGVSPRRRIGEPGLRRGEESGNLLGDAPLLGRGERLLGESTVFRGGEATHIDDNH